MEKVDLREKLKSFAEAWVPKVVGELNGQFVKVAHFEGEYVAAALCAEITGRAPPGAYVAPARIVALALGPDDGVLCYGRVVVLRGRAVPWVKALVERWVVRLWPLPYELFRRLPALA